MMLKIFSLSFPDFVDRLQNQLQQPLPGYEAHLPLSSIKRLRAIMKQEDISKARNSAVLILLYQGPGGVIMTVVIQRPKYNGVHSGQISFPGGKAEPEDDDLIQTALRESYEEIGVKPGAVNIIGCLSELFIPPSNMKVLPVVGYQQCQPTFIKDNQEVDEVIPFCLEELFRTETMQKRLVTVGKWSEEVPCFYINGQVIWGATAMILNELKTIIRSIR